MISSAVSEAGGSGAFAVGSGAFAVGSGALADGSGAFVDRSGALSAVGETSWTFAPRFTAVPFSCAAFRIHTRGWACDGISGPLSASGGRDPARTDAIHAGLLSNPVMSAGEPPVLLGSHLPDEMSDLEFATFWMRAREAGRLRRGRLVFKSRGRAVNNWNFSSSEASSVSKW